MRPDSGLAIAGGVRHKQATPGVHRLVLRPRMPMKDATLTASHADLANAIRFLSADAVEKANSGHPGMPMGMADVATVLFTQELKYDPSAPRWADRDRFVLSAGHGSMLIYALLNQTGYARPPMDDIRNFRQLGS